MKSKKIKLSVIIPVFNEAKTISELIKRVKAVKISKEIIIVDDGSSDGTKLKLKNLKKKNYKNIKIIFHSKNFGKGKAVRTGINHASGNYILIQDADLEYDPQDYFKLIKPVKQNKAEVVYGSRFTGERRNMFFWHFVANRTLSFLTNLLYNTTLSDMETCYKLFPAKLLKSLPLTGNRFEFEPEVTARVLKKGIRIYEVPISYVGREYHEGKKIYWIDGLIAFYTLIKYKFIS